MVQEQSTNFSSRRSATVKQTAKKPVVKKAAGQRPVVENVVISVGGSLIVPDDISTSFLLALKRCLIGYTSRKKHFVLVCGGGAVSRHYQQAANRLSQLSAHEIDWMGIHGTRFNAELVRMILNSYTGKNIVLSPDEKIKLTSQKPIAVAGGWKPGWSTDYVAVRIAKQLQAKRVINLSDIDYVYDKDPQQYSEAAAITEITWSKFRALIPKAWDPGLSSPFDPVASKEAEKLGLEVAIINGQKLAQFEHYLNGRPFRGTTIKD